MVGDGRSVERARQEHVVPPKQTRVWRQGGAHGQRRGAGRLPSAVLDLTAAPWVMAPGFYAPLADVLQAFLNGRLLWDRGFWLIEGMQMQYRSPPSALPGEP
ncbi:hypothetical protein D3C85_1046880 [compost metagenome]